MTLAEIMVARVPGWIPVGMYLGEGYQENVLRYVGRKWKGIEVWKYRREDNYESDGIKKMDV